MPLHARAGITPVRICAAALAWSVVWFAVFAVHPVGPPAVLWISIPVDGVVVSWAFLQASYALGMSPANRAFWRRMVPVPGLVALGQSVEAIDLLAHPRTGFYRASPPMLVIDGVALLVVVHALVRLPTGRSDRGGRLRIMLDASTVMLATAAFFWHFGTRAAVTTLAPGDDPAGHVGVGTAAVSLSLHVLAVLAAFAVSRVLFSTHRAIDRRGLHLLAAGTFLGALAPLAQPAVADLDPRLSVMELGLPAVYLFAAMAAARQRRIGDPQRPAPSGRRSRAYSVLPYAAVGAVDALLLAEVNGDQQDVRVLAAGAVVLTAVVVIRQVTALRDNERLLAQLDHGATHDSLTGLANRVLFQRRLREALDAPGEGPVGVVLIDLDDFKEVNDTLGHEVGDVLLVDVARRLTACVGRGDTVARLGGDEFVMVLADGDPESADLVAVRIVEALRRPVLAGGYELAIRASIGIADGRSGDEPSLLLRRADIAMYAAKAITGTAFLHFQAGMRVSEDEQADLAAQLREAVDGEELFLLYQPIVDLKDGRLVGAEALVRWSHPEHGVLGPEVFIPVAERSGLSARLGRWVVRTALRQFATWPDGPEGAVPPTLNVNLSARELREPGLATEIGGILDELGLDPTRVTFEITESAALEGADAADTLHQLRALGSRICLDDFGTGYSTLSLLHECPVDELKLDRSFTQAPESSRTTMTEAVLHLSKVLGLRLVAEGVETAEQAERLRRVGYSAAQGYYFGRPVPPERFADLYPQSAARLRVGAPWSALG